METEGVYALRPLLGQKSQVVVFFVFCFFIVCFVLFFIKVIGSRENVVSPALPQPPLTNSQLGVQSKAGLPAA